MALFGKDRSSKNRAILVSMLNYIVAAGSVGAMIPGEKAKEIQKLEPTFIEVKSAADPIGNVLAVATPAGVEASGATPAVPVAEGTVVKPVIELEGGFVPPAIKRGGGLREEIYPFSTMSVVPAPGSSFFLAATEAEPEPWKKLQSAVGSANKRFANAVFPATFGKDNKPHPKAGQPTGRDVRKFTVRQRTAGVDGEKLTGARVYRIA